MFLGRYDEAYDQLQSARELDPLSCVVGVNLGALLLYTGKTRDAIEQFETAIEANPDFPYIHTVLGFAYYLESRINEAISELRKGLVMSGGIPNRRRIWPAYSGSLAFVTKRTSCLKNSRNTQEQSTSLRSK